MKKFIIMAGSICLLLIPTPAKACDCAHKITKEQILASQKAWGDGVVAIGVSADLPYNGQ